MWKSRLLLLGSFLAVFLMLMVPSIDAVEYSVAEKVNKDFYLSRVKTFLSCGSIDIIALIEIILSIILANVYSTIFMLFVYHFGSDILLALEEYAREHGSIGVLIVSSFIVLSLVVGLEGPPAIIFWIVCRILQHQLRWSVGERMYMFALLLVISNIITFIINTIIYILLKTTHPSPGFVKPVKNLIYPKSLLLEVME